MKMAAKKKGSKSAKKVKAGAKSKKWSFKRSFLWCFPFFCQICSLHSLWCPANYFNLAFAHTGTSINTLTIIAMLQKICISPKNIIVRLINKSKYLQLAILISVTIFDRFILYFYLCSKDRYIESSRFENQMLRWFYW